MPVYEYFCETCRQLFEVTKKMADPDPVVCPEGNAREGLPGHHCRVIKQISRFSARVQSPNPLAHRGLSQDVAEGFLTQGASSIRDQGANGQEASHTCYSGCVHNAPAV